MELNRKFLHIIPPSKRMMNTYVSMIRENFNMEEHTFMFFEKCTKADEVLFEYGNVEYLCESNKWIDKYKAMYKMYKKYDYVIWHGFLYGGKYMIFLLVFQLYLKKTIWIMRGIDLYNWKHKNKSLKKKIVNLMNYYIRKKIPNVVAIFPTDIEVYRQQFGNKSNIYCLPYPLSKDSFRTMDKLSKRKPRINGEIWIQICNNAYAFNNHIGILNYIKKFSDKNVRLFIPLSYGNDYINIIHNYKNKVKISYVSEFGEEKIEVLNRLMPPDEYTNLICNIDIGIFGSERQNALGNILRQMYIGNKVFLTKSNPLYVFLKKIGIDINSIEDIQNMNFKEFTKQSNNAYSQDWIYENFHPESNFKAWDNLFKKLELKKKSKQLDLFVYNISTDKNNIISTEKNVGVQKYKNNFIQVCKYTSTNPNLIRNFTKLKNIYILGDEEYSQIILQNIIQQNIYSYRYIPMGIISDEKLSINNIQKPMDIVGDIEDYIKCKSINDYIITAISDCNKRQEIVERLLQKSECKDLNDKIEDVNFINLESLINEGYGVKKGYGCCITHDTRIGINTSVGNHTYIIDSTIGIKCFIGNYVTIKPSCTICDGVFINDKVVIGEGSIIYPNVIISEGIIIGPGSKIRKSI
ncbi:hypothetical protein FDA33_14760 [Clostridium botulinum]|nr:hypothetical protein [Clostridium botulinum]NFI18616.1 hypothetical protein [Clostridium botulinum]NFL93232.1 hypothetical protein [Clostridium botulinum]NFN52794.1 hypothetical protein [Clostridium botulinum]NFO27761.1 hypothetical protein [Clostridium botulinum]